MAIALALALAVSTCAGPTPDKQAKSNTVTPAPSTAPIDRSNEPAYAIPGPHLVGITTLDLGDRKVEVFYPATPGSEDGKAPEGFQGGADEAEARGQERSEQFAAHQVPAYRDLPADGSTEGGYPVILFSHGFGADRHAYVTMLAGIASWGFVIAAPDHIERGTAMLLGTVDQVEEAHDDRDDLRGALAVLEEQSGQPASLLAGSADTSAVVVAGHSAGGLPALRMADEPGVSAVVGIAPLWDDYVPTSDVPVMLIAAEQDIARGPTKIDGVYDAFGEPVRYFVIDNIGHNTWTDYCVGIRDAGGSIALPDDIDIPQTLLDLGTNGCQPDDLAPNETWAITQHLLVAFARVSLGIDPVPIGLGDEIVDAFPGATLHYRHKP